MKRQAYLDLIEKHRKEMNDFPIAYAFSDKQLEEALEKLGAKKEECVSIYGHGDVIKKSDVPAFKDMLKRHKQEVLDAMKDPEFAEAAFLYEMDNHEYCINWSGDEDVLGCFYMEVEDLDEMGLRTAYMLARKKHMDNAREFNMI